MSCRMMGKIDWWPNWSEIQSKINLLYVIQKFAQVDLADQQNLLKNLFYDTGFWHNYWPTDHIPIYGLWGMATQSNSHYLISIFLNL